MDRWIDGSMESDEYRDESAEYFGVKEWTTGQIMEREILIGIGDAH